MKQDVVRAIGYINLVLAEAGNELWEEEVRTLQEARTILLKLCK